MKKFATIILGFIVGAFAMVATPAMAARTDAVWDNFGTYMKTVMPNGLDVWINGINHYLNFGTIQGSSGYGFRDNAGTMEFKDFGGSWAAFGTGGGGGGGSAGAWATTTNNVLTYLTTQWSALIGGTATTSDARLSVFGSTTVSGTGMFGGELRVPNIVATSTTGTSTFPFLYSSTSTISNLNGVIYVDGVRFAKTGAGIQEALDFCSSLGGGTVFIPTGNYIVSSNLSFYSNCYLKGAGYSSLLTLAQGVSLRLWNVSHSGIDNIRIDALAHIAFDVGISSINSSDIRITNNYGDFAGFGIFTNTNGSNISTSTWITDNYVIGHGNNDVIGGGANATTSTVTDVFVSRNHCIQNANEGTGYTACIDMVKALGWSYTDNTVYGDVYFGAEVSPNKFSIISGNKQFPAIGASSGILSVAVNVDDTDSSKGIIISNNTLRKSYINLSGNAIAKLLESQIIGNSIVGEGFPAYCIKLSDVLYSNVTGNSCQGVINAIVLGGNSQYNNVTSNTIDNSTIGITESVGTAGNNTYANNIMVAVTTELSNINTSSTIVSSRSGNYAIGTTTPYSKLTLWGSSSLFEAVNNSSSTIFSIGQSGATTTNLGITNQIYANGSATSSILHGLLTALNTGSLFGIGTNNPQTKLDVVGGGVATGVNPLFAVRNNQTSTGAESTMILTNTTASSYARSSGSGEIGVIRTNSPSAGNSEMVFRVVDNAGGGLLERMRIAYNGNVGIGTTSPYAKLSVAGPVAADSFNATNTNATSTFSGRMTIGYGIASSVYQETASPLYIQNQSLDSSSLLTKDQYLMLRQVNGTNNNAVGIGFDASSGVYAPSTQASGAILYRRIGSAGYGDMEFYVRRNGGVPTLSAILENTGNFGIGTTSPYAKLSVAGQIVGQNFIATSTTATSTIFGDLSVKQLFNAEDDLYFSGASKNIFVKVGTNQTFGTSTLSGGTVTVSNTLIRADSLVQLTTCVAGGTLGSLSVGTRVAGTSFVINSTNVLDTSTVCYEIKQPVY